MAMANLLTCAVVLLVLHTASLSHCQSVGQSTGNQLSSSVLTEVKQRALFPADTNPFRLDFNTLPVGALFSPLHLVRRARKSTQFA